MISVFDLFHDDINATRKKIPVEQIKKSKYFWQSLRRSTHQIDKLPNSWNWVMDANENITNVLVVVKNVNCNLENPIKFSFKDFQTKVEREFMNRRIHVSMLRISNKVLVKDLGKPIIRIYKDSDIYINHKDNERSLHLLRKNNTKDKKRNCKTSK